MIESVTQFWIKHYYISLGLNLVVLSIFCKVHLVVIDLILTKLVLG